MGLGSIVGLFSGTGDVKAPNVSKVGQDYTGLLNAVTGNTGKLFDTQAQYQPKYSDLNLQDILRIMPMLISSLGALGPQASNIVRGINPTQTSLMDKLAQQAGEGLDSRAPSYMRQMSEQAIREAQSARGMGRGPSDVLQESNSVAKLEGDWRQQQQEFARGVVGDQANYQTNPALAFMQGIPDAAGQISGSAGANLLNPASSLGLLQLPYQGRLSANTSTSANNTSLVQSADSNSSSFISGL